MYLWLIAGFVMILGAVAAFVFLDREMFHINSALLERLAQADLSPAEPNPPTRGDWPQWRGPYRDGVSRETGLLTVWPEGGLKQLWQAKTGAGYSSMAVAGGRVFCLLQDGPEEAAVCWNAETGQELWRFKYPCEYKDAQGNGPRATPAMDGDRVYTVGATGILHCLKTSNGEKLWQHDLAHEFSAPRPAWGVSFSPLIEGDLLLTNPGGPNGSSIVAFNKITGDEVWKSLNDPPAYSSPIAATIDGRRQILFFTHDGLVSVAPQEGALLWRFPWDTRFGANVATPIVVSHYVFISSNYDKGCALLDVSISASSWQVRPVYEHNRMRNHFSTSVYYKEHLYGFDDATLVCMNFRTGKIAWKKKDFKRGSLLVADGRLIILGESGTLALAEATPDDYQELASFPFSTKKCWTVPVVANGRLYVRDEERIVCYDLRGQ
jgi:outer membrane protein assembly factor BamB